MIRRLKYECNIKDCYQTYSKLADLKEHLIYFHNQCEPTFACPHSTCNTQYSSSKDLSKHLKSSHADFICTICDKKFLEEIYLKKHVLTLHNENESSEKFKCKLCAKEFAYKSNLNVHIKRTHLKEKFKCIYCEKSLSSKQKLENHKLQLHAQMDICIDESEVDRILSDLDETTSYTNKNNDQAICMTSSESSNSCSGSGGDVVDVASDNKRIHLEEKNKNNNFDLTYDDLEFLNTITFEDFIDD